MLTNFFGLISPEAETTEMRSSRPTFWVCTLTLLRRSRITLPATTPPIMTAAATPARIRDFLDDNMRPPFGACLAPTRSIRMKGAYCFVPGGGPTQRHVKIPALRVPTRARTPGGSPGEL